MTNKLALMTADVAALLWSYEDVSEGSNENDVCVASMHHFFRCYVNDSHRITSTRG